MDWAPTEVMEAVGELAGQILATSEQPWEDLVEAGLLEVEGWLETLALVRAVGRSTVDVPVIETLVLGAPGRERFPEGELPAGVVFTAALQEAGRPDPRQARTRRVGKGLVGVKVAVPAGMIAEYIVVPAVEGLFLVRGSEVRRAAEVATDGSTLASLELLGTEEIWRLGDPALVEGWTERVNLAICALLLGVAERALELTAAYVKERKQFGMPIGMFQAVSQRAADAWIDLQVMEVALWRAAWMQEQGLDCTREVLIARSLANEGVHRVVAAAQHLHGGMGYDRDYPLHRCFLLAKRWEFVLGGMNRQLAELGKWQRRAAGS